MRVWCVLLFGVFVACGGSGADSVPFVPSGASHKRDAGADASDDAAAHPGGTHGGAHSAGGSGVDGGGELGDGGMAPSDDAGAPAAQALAPGTMLVEVKYEKLNKCALQAVSPGKTGRTAPFDCNIRNDVFRRSDRTRFYVLDGKVYSDGALAKPTLVNTACDVAGGVDFDAKDHMAYRCTGGTTADLYLDDTLLAANLVAEFGGVLDDGRIFFHAFEEYNVLAADGSLLENYATPSRFTALEDATTIAGNSATMLWVDNTDDLKPQYVVMRYDDKGFSEVVRLDPKEPPPSNFGAGHRLDPSGALYVALDGKVRRYDPDGSSKIVWNAPPGVSVSSGAELVYFPGTK
jgi:hypothetical protein